MNVGSDLVHFGPDVVTFTWYRCDVCSIGGVSLKLFALGQHGSHFFTQSIPSLAFQ